MATKKKLGKFATMELNLRLKDEEILILRERLDNLSKYIEGQERQLSTAQRSLVAFQRFDKDLEALLISVRGGSSMKIRSF